MRNRKSVIRILLFAALLILFLWVFRQYSQFTKPSDVAVAPEAHLGPPDIYPDSALTPGAINPDITQENISETICNPRWSTKSIRPEAAYTNRLKAQQIGEYGYADSQMQDYEEDHFIPLELGGNPTDPKNLWPEPLEASIPDGGAHAKDGVENHLHAEVCSGSLTLDEAQRAIVQDWYRVYLSYH